jgi:hypothetical protein
MTKPDTDKDPATINQWLNSLEISATTPPNSR